MPAGPQKRVKKTGILPAPPVRPSLSWQVRPAQNGQRTTGERFQFSPDEERLLQAAQSALARKTGLLSGDEYKKAVVAACRALEIPLKLERAHVLAEALRESLEGYGILGEFLHDDHVEEIAVNGARQPVRIFLRGNGWKDTNVFPADDPAVLALANKMARPLGRRLSFQNPRLNACLPDGNRLHAVLPPVALDGPTLTLRKFRESPFTVPELVRRGTLAARTAGFLWLACLTDANLLVVGNTGSGKTTLLNALFAFMPADERVILVEDTPELKPPQAHTVRLVASPETGNPLQSLVQDTLRMRPDRLAVGEARKPEETRALFDALSSGQAKGTYATFHGRSSQEAFRRLESHGIRDDELQALDLVIVLRRANAYHAQEQAFCETRSLTEICGVENNRIRPLFLPREGKLETENVAGSRMWERIAETFGSQPEARKAWSQRTAFIEDLARQDTSSDQIINALQEYGRPAERPATT